MVVAARQKASQKVTGSRYKIGNLVSLVWPVNTCYSSLINGIPKGVTVDLEKGTWTFNGHTRPIGKSERYPGFIATGAPIGVFDRTLFNHLEEFKYACEWVRTRNDPAGE